MNMYDDIAHIIKAGMEKAALRHEIETLKAENQNLKDGIERLEKAGDNTIDLLGKTDVPYEEYSDAKDKWDAAKGGTNK